MGAVWAGLKSARTIVISVLIAGMLIAPSVDAFKKGDNRIQNGDFEASNVGEPPTEWLLTKGG